MGIIVYLGILAMLVFICVKNFSLLKRYKNNKKYIACYRDVLKDETNTYEHLNDYIAKQKSDEYKNKARILKLYIELKDNLNYDETLNSLDLRKIYYSKKDELDKNLLVFNSDSFVFIMMAMSKAYASGKLDVVTELYEKVKAVVGLNEQVEFLEIIALHNALLNVNDCGIAFMNCLLNGEYTQYKYDKNMIGVYKRIAAATLAFKSQYISEFDDEDLHTFAKSLIGKQILTDLRLYDKYTATIEESSQE